MSKYNSSSSKSSIQSKVSTNFFLSTVAKGPKITIEFFLLVNKIIILNNKELVYIRSHGIEKFNIITKKKQFFFFKFKSFLNL